jgi:CubicO group peptidase (beta-lactamase class C family)
MPLSSLAIAVFAVFMVASGLVAQQAPDLVPKVDAIFARYDRNTPGCAVGLAKDGKPLVINAYGAANLEYGIPNTDSTVFESGSVAKQFTAAAIVLLAQDRKLSLDDDIRKYLPEVPSFGGQTITIRNLLTHTSGLRDQWGLLGIEGRGPGTQVHSPATTLDLVAHQKMLNFSPGTAYLYSNTGYALAVIIVQRVSKKTLEAFSHERIFRPLGMVHTQWREDFTKVVRNRATAYRGSAAAGFRTDMPFTDMIGNGGLLSTMQDLMIWNENLDTPRQGTSFVNALETPMRLKDGRTIDYGLGLSVNEFRGVREMSHDGSTAGYRTFLARYPQQHVSVAVWCNNASANPNALGREVAALVLKFPPPVTAQAEPKATVPKAELLKWQGMYRDELSGTTTILTANDSALAQGTGNGTGSAAWTPLGGSRFRSPQGEATFSMIGGMRRITLVRPRAETATYWEVAPPPARVPAGDYVGTYASDELDVRLVVATRGTKLFMRRRPNDEFELVPTFADGFRAGGGFGSVRFTRDARGKVTGLSIFAGRVLDVRFKRVP